jgi:hypothetical protein
MRFASFRYLRSLAAQLLVTYVAALILTMCCIVIAIWLGSSRDADMASQGQLRAAVELIHGSVRFNSAGVPVLAAGIASLPPDLSRVFRDFASEIKYRILDRSGHVLISSENDTGVLAPAGQPFDLTLSSFALVSSGETLFVRTEPMVTARKPITSSSQSASGSRRSRGHSTRASWSAIPGDSRSLPWHYSLWRFISLCAGY